MSVGTKIATLVDDSKMRLSMYVNYAYQNDIAVGQSAVVSIPASMTQVTGTVEAVNMVRYITPEGSQCFEVVLVMDNPGTPDRRDGRHCRLYLPRHRRGRSTPHSAGPWNITAPARSSPRPAVKRCPLT